MKIKKQVLAWGLVAGLAGVSGGAAVGDQPSADSTAQAGYYLAKKIAKAKKDLDEGALQAFLQALGATAGAGTGAIIGAKFGALGGPIGAGIGAGLGAL